MKRIFWIITIIFSLGLGLLWELAPEPELSDRLNGIPMKGVNFYGREIPLTEEEQQVLGEAGVIKRSYVFNGKGFLFTIMDGSRNRSAVHDPSFCYRGSNSQVEDAGTLRLASGDANLLRVQQENGSTLEVLTWFSQKNRQFCSFPKYWALSAWRRLSFGTATDEPLLVTVRTISRGETPVDWSVTAEDLFPQMGL